MVEFGLKLEDNKVEEWNDKYIDYEGLKKLIKTAKKTASARAELEKRNPSSAAAVKAKYGSKRSLHDSNSALDSVSEFNKDESLHGDFSVSAHGEAPMGDKVLLMTNIGQVSRYGSNESRNDSTGSVGTFLRGVKRGLPFRNYEVKLQDALETENLAKEKFTISIYQEVSKVSSFYRGIADEIESRFNLLIQNTGDSYQFKKHKKQLLKNMRKSLKKRVTGFSNDVNSESMEGTEDSDEETEAFLTSSQRRTFDEKVREANSIKRALTDMHRRAKLLNNYTIINSTGFIKITKKYTKNFPLQKEEFERLSREDNICGGGKRAEELCTKMEQCYANWFCDGNISEARSHMLPKKGDGLDMDWSQLRLGYRLGMCSILMCWVAWDCVWGLVNDGHSTIGGRTAFPVFRGCGGLLLVHWFWGISVYIWNRYRINYIFLLDFDPRIVDTPISIFEDATDESLVFLLLMLVYYKAGAGDIPDIIPAGMYPLFLVLYTIKCLIFPLKTRKPMWKAIVSVVSSPITSPSFIHTYIADVFTSMVKVFQDIAWTTCFIASGDFLVGEHKPDSDDDDVHYSIPILWHEKLWYKNVLIPLICLFPLWIRFNQCLRRYLDTGKRAPHLPNALKYAISQTVTLFGAFHPLYLMHHEKGSRSGVSDTETHIYHGTLNIFEMFWFGVFIASSLYSYFWDVYMDWGLGRKEHAFLGSRLMFPKRSYYYLVMAADFFLRFMWVTTLIPPQSGAAFEIPNYLTLVTMAMELLRRTIWGFFRMEHEHRHNTQGFRRVGFVPLHFTTGHDHKYNRKKERVGWSVLGEVMVITLIVLSISAASVISAQKATNGMAMVKSARDDIDL